MNGIFKQAGQLQESFQAIGNFYATKTFQSQIAFLTKQVQRANTSLGGFFPYQPAKYPSMNPTAKWEDFFADVDQMMFEVQKHGHSAYSASEQAWVDYITRVLDEVSTWYDMRSPRVKAYYEASMGPNGPSDAFKALFRTDGNTPTSKPGRDMGIS